MALQIRCGDPDDNEVEAIEVLRGKFGDEWALLTNIPPSIAGREIDACLLGPRGMIVLELKFHSGEIHCSRVGSWKGMKEDKNPLEQAGKAAQKLKSFLVEYDPLLSAVYVDSIVLMTNVRCKLTIDPVIALTSQVGRLWQDATTLVDTRVAKFRGLSPEVCVRAFEAITGIDVPPKLIDQWLPTISPSPTINEGRSEPEGDQAATDLGLASVQAKRYTPNPNRPPPEIAAQDEFWQERKNLSKAPPGTLYRGALVAFAPLLAIAVLVGLMVGAPHPNSAGPSGGPPHKITIESARIGRSLASDDKLIDVGTSFIGPIPSIAIRVDYRDGTIGQDTIRITLMSDRMSDRCADWTLRTVSGYVACRYNNPLPPGQYIVHVATREQELAHTNFEVTSGASPIPPLANRTQPVAKPQSMPLDLASARPSVDAEPDSSRQNSGPSVNNPESIYYVVNTKPPDAFLSLRSEPSAVAGFRVAQLPNGTELKVLIQRPDRWWRIRVMSTSQEGWALSGQGRTTWIECCRDPAPRPSGSDATNLALNRSVEPLQYLISIRPDFPWRRDGLLFNFSDDTRAPPNKLIPYRELEVTVNHYFPFGTGPEQLHVGTGGLLGTGYRMYSGSYDQNKAEWDRAIIALRRLGVQPATPSGSDRDIRSIQ